MRNHKHRPSNAMAAQPNQLKTLLNLRHNQNRFPALAQRLAAQANPAAVAAALKEAAGILISKLLIQMR